MKFAPLALVLTFGAAIAVAWAGEPATPELASDLADRVRAAAQAGSVKAIAQLAVDNPHMAIQIASVGTAANPTTAPSIAAAVSSVLPNLAPDVAGAVAAVAPNQAPLVVGSVANVCPAQVAPIAAAVAAAVPPQAGVVAAVAVNVAPAGISAIAAKIAATTNSTPAAIQQQIVANTAPTQVLAADGARIAKAIMTTVAHVKPTPADDDCVGCGDE